MIKKIYILLLIFMITILSCTGCGEKAAEAIMSSSEESLVCVVSTASGLSSNAAWYIDNSFDFNYDELPVLTIHDSDTLLFSVDWDTDVLTVGEDYYEHPTEQSAICYKKTYELEKNDDGLFELQIQRHKNICNEQAIYYIVNDEGKFIIKVLFPTTESNT